MEWSEEELTLFTLAHYPYLTYKEKWTLACERIVTLSGFSQNCVGKATVNRKKRASFLRYEKNIPIMQLTEQYEKLSIRYLSILSPLYPSQLRHSYEPPLVLFYSGQLSLLSLTLLGVVGARECTPYAQLALNVLLPDLADSGIGIVSGLAKGVDGLAHQYAVSSEQPTIAVIGTGLDRVYPTMHSSLQQEMTESQLVITEYPLGTPPKKHHFPARNRIIAGLSRGVLVIEARKRSGSLITARMALEEGRDVFAVPGSIVSELSEGCNDLIKAGAIPCSSGKDILDEWNFEIVNK